MKAAIYARYSTDKQSEASIADQIRVCERLAERDGFEIVARFQDAALSGGTIHRPGYQAMLAAARRGDFNVIVAEDTSRLWRNLGEQAPRLNELADLGIAVVTHNLDTRHESAAILSAVSGAMSEEYRREIGRRTRRGLEGLARQGKSTGGRAYGYIAAKDSPTGTRQIQPEQAAIIIRIFEMYRDGFSPRAIADQLNVERIPSPGASWKREKRRRAGWLGSAIAGDSSRGVGILNNELYVGRVTWNRHRWLRSASDSQRRRCVPNPPSGCITRFDESLRIVSEALWQSVKARQRHQAELIGRRVVAGLRQRNAGSTGPGPKYLLSGLLKCGSCGAAYVIASSTSYACSSYVNGNACKNNVWFRRDAVETAIVDSVRRNLATPAAAEEISRRVRARLRELSRPRPANRAKIAELEAQLVNLIDAVAAGGLRGSAGLAERLRIVESELAGLKAQAAASDTRNVEKLLPDIAARYARQLDRLPEILAHDVTRARAALATHVGPLTVKTTDTEIQFYNEKGHAEAALLRAAAGGSNICGSGGRI